LISFVEKGFMLLVEKTSTNDNARIPLDRMFPEEK
jgi:hypothetical protein